MKFSNIFQLVCYFYQRYRNANIIIRSSCQLYWTPGKDNIFFEFGWMCTAYCAVFTEVLTVWVAETDQLEGIVLTAGELGAEIKFQQFS